MERPIAVLEVRPAVARGGMSRAIFSQGSAPAADVVLSADPMSMVTANAPERQPWSGALLGPAQHRHSSLRPHSPVASIFIRKASQPRHALPARRWSQPGEGRNCSATR